MYQGEPAKVLEFYKRLNESEEFTSELGKVVLASGKLEAELIIFLINNGIEVNYNKVTLGILINIAERNQMLDNNELQALKMVKEQRNYITHNIYALFVDLKDETILEKNNLLDSDVHLYVERAWQLRGNLNEIAEIIRQKN